MGYNYIDGVNKKVLLIFFIMIIGYMIIEVIGGFLMNSLVFLLDVGYMLSDLILLMIVLIVFKLVEKKVSYNKMFGYK